MSEPGAPALGGPASCILSRVYLRQSSRGVGGLNPVPLESFWNPKLYVGPVWVDSGPFLRDLNLASPRMQGPFLPAGSVAWRPRPFTGQSGEMLTDYLRWLRVSLAVSVVPGCGALIFIIGDPFCQYITMALIMTMAFQLRIQRNRGE